MCYLIWREKDTPAKRSLFQLAPSMPRIDEIECGLWPTMSSQLAGEGDFLETLETKEGEPPKQNERAYNPKTGKHVQVTLNRAVKMWPSPRAGNPGSRPNQKGGKILAEEVKKSLWPTPSASTREGTVSGGHPGLAGGSGNRQKLYNMLGYEKGKEMGCQSLNPNWVEWLMGFPIGWTDLNV